ncbi:His/Glu/Gln/Arg/opine family amino ABC transporter, permease, 3-TM region [Enterococcus moraviensis ATCC BAA-383]|uniref:Amino acid ABC transporter amino acid-binding/permease n=1 Tax=Enterococcus moraviensis ATCC BAA-383 TaxID=1158609 RepID=R2QUM2_9ENTE|nr:amino acid ABC transporter substrate-binding protein/permease [Enterococcus moraviensis]EOH99008.1 His/Glu/Gln/Arg/opine family amino ABC transporter, permease, 3-TM region [Enterococcus moraviensis ATCC BAA-383]EOT71817.1 amino acid ABC transporter amino acid-binding/permease [Enterococcus moraviensis ATCC BAA-383]OJG67935.1 His/Glu/Gln/Arg/opine family amino ABC transporter, permease, 3-TM region [Enterococcus moraviensis]
MKRKHFLLSFIVMMASLLTFTLGQTAQAEEKTYNIGTDLTFAPFEFQDSKGEYVGIDVDLLQAIAKDQDFKVNLKPLGFDSAIQAVQSKQVDGMIAGMSITDERKKSFDFSEPYFDSGLQMAVKKGNDKIKGYEDLKGKTVAAKVGTESATFLEKNQEKYGFTIKNFDDATGLYQALENGEADAIFDDYPVLGYAITNGQKLQLVGKKETGSSYGFAVKKGQNKELIEKFNAGLKELKSSGKYDEIISKYISTGTETTDTDSKMKKIQPKKDTYVIASDSTFAPFEFQNSDGKYEGIDVDLVNRIAELQDFTIEFKFIGFSSAVQAVESGQADAMIAGMTITDEREKSFDFSTPYFNSGIQIAVKKGNDNIHSYKDLKDKKVGAKIGTESADFLEANKDKYGYSIKYLDTTDALYSALEINEIDAMMDDYPVIGYGVAQKQPLITPIPREEGGKYGFAVKKGKNPELIQMFNEGLAELKRTGEYDEIIGKYVKDGSTENKVDESTFVGMIQNNWKRLLNGLWMTIQLTLISFILALIVGVLFGLFSASPSKTLRVISTIYVDIIRGIPLMVLAFFIYFGLPGILGFNIPVFLAGIITLTLNASAYISEIVRGGIKAVPVGQMEASRSLGLSYNRTMQKIILPQAIKIMIPSFVNQFVISLKDTTILSAIGLIELLQTGKIIVARNLQSTMVYFVIAMMYLILITALTKLAKVLEKKVK